MKKLLAVLSVLMLVIGVVTLAAGTMNIGLLSSIENGGPMAGAPAWCPCCTSSAPWPSAPAATEPPLTERGMCL